MSYAAIEVELHDGHILARGPEPLPRAGTGLLVILSSETGTSGAAGGPSWLPALVDIRQRQAARGHAPRTADAVVRQVHLERESWE